MHGSGYSSDKCPLPIYTPESVCSVDNGVSLENGEQIDLDAIDKVLYSDYNSMFEIKNPDGDDIRIRCKSI